MSEDESERPREGKSLSMQSSSPPLSTKESGSMRAEPPSRPLKCQEEKKNASQSAGTMIDKVTHAPRSSTVHTREIEPQRV